LALQVICLIEVLEDPFAFFDYDSAGDSPVHTDGALIPSGRMLISINVEIENIEYIEYELVAVVRGYRIK